MVLLLIKPQLAIVILAVILLRHSREEWLYALAGIAATFLMGLAAGGFSAYEAFARQTAHMAGTTTGSHWGAADNFTALAQLQTFLGYGTVSRIAWLLCSAVIIGACLWLAIRTHRALGTPATAEAVPWLACAALTLLVANHLQYHDLTLIYPAALVALGTRHHKIALVIIAAAWLDPILYPATRVHMMVLACTAALVIWAVSEYRRGSLAATMDRYPQRSSQDSPWKLLKHRRWGSASGSETPST